MIDGTGEYEVFTGIRFLDHMLELFTKHGGFDLQLWAKGDLDVDQHHTVEDVGIVLGQLFSKALGDRKGINRAGYFVQTDGRDARRRRASISAAASRCVYKDRVKVRRVGDLQVELVEDFFDGFAQHAASERPRARCIYGRSNHHKIEAIFKCFARAMQLRLLHGRTAERSAAFH